MRNSAGRRVQGSHQHQHQRIFRFSLRARKARLSWAGEFETNFCFWLIWASLVNGFLIRWFLGYSPYF